MYSKLPPRASGLPLKKRSQSQIQTRARLNGPLIYGEEAIRALRSNQPIPNSKQMFRQDQGGNNNRPTKSSFSPNAAVMTPRTMITELRTRTPPPTGKYYSPGKNDLGSRRPIDTAPHESFAEFSRRVNTLTANKLDLDPNLHDSFVELSLGQRPQNSAFDHGPDSCRNSPTASGRLIPRVDTANVGLYRSTKAYETTFALHEARSSGSESDSFHPADRYWRNALLKQKSSKKEPYRKQTFIPPSAVGPRYRGMGNWPGNQNSNSQQRSSSGLFKSNIIEDGQIILREASRLLSESTKLRMKKEREVPVQKPSKHFGYVPLKVKGLNRNPKVTFHDKIQKRREIIKVNGYTPVDPIVEEIRELWKEGEKSSNVAPTSAGKMPEKVEGNRGPFGGKKLSSLVAKNVTALQGRGLSMTESDEMNPIERRLLEGLENYELSYFLPGPGHKSPKPREPPRPLLKKDKNPLGLAPGIGQTSLIDSLKDYYPSPRSGRPGAGESKVTRYLEELRLSGYPDKMPSKARAEKRREAAKFMENDDQEFDESILNDFKMSPERREELLEAMRDRRLQRIRAKAAGVGTRSDFANPTSHISRVMGGVYGKF